MSGFLSIPAFCAEYAVHRSTLYRLLAAGTGPRTTKLGRRTLISRVAAEEWRAAIDGGQIETERLPSLAEAQRGRR
jgi:predicted DNA-binding transcriptional regulator AlpA